MSRICLTLRTSDSELDDDVGVGCEGGAWSRMVDVDKDREGEGKVYFWFESTSSGESR
jgi:hypothetical protein